MRKIKVSMYMALDGVVENPMWTFPYWNDEIAEMQKNALFSSDALLLGRVTYEAFAEAWPGREDEMGFAQRINAMRKYVVSTTMTEGNWGETTIIREDVTGEIRKLKEKPGDDIIVYGGVSMVDTLLKDDLADEINVITYPILIGGGDKFFRPRETPYKLKLIEARPFPSGVVSLRYAPDTDKRE